MTPEEINKIAAAIAAEVVRRFGGPGEIAGQPAEFECFTCSGRFKCRPSFMITTTPPAGGGSAASSAA
ncbi:MAG: hypothetical protein ACFCUO_12690 [Rhodospirillales bacterium]